MQVTARYRDWPAEVQEVTLRSALRVAGRSGRLSHPATALHFRDPEFQAASELVRMASARGWPLALLSSAVKGRDSVRAVQTLLHLPIVTVALTPSEERAWKADPFPPAARSIYQGHLGQAILHLDQDDDSYLTGRHRRQMRSRIKGALRRGARAVSIHSFADWMQMARPVLEGRPRGPEELAVMSPPDPTQRMGYFAALDDQGAPVALGGTAMFGRAAVLFALVSHPAHPAAGEARYLLHDFIRSSLRDRGLELLITGSGLGIPEGLQLFQDLLGYSICNLDLVRTRPQAL